jgi:hypothetical protein
MFENVLERKFRDELASGRFHQFENDNTTTEEHIERIWNKPVQIQSSKHGLNLYKVSNRHHTKIVGVYRRIAAVLWSSEFPV